MNYRQAKTGKLMIEILPDKCDFCGCCVGICPEDAIELKEAEVIKFNREGVLAK
jgi:ferredoxin